MIRIAIRPLVFVFIALLAPADAGVNLWNSSAQDISVPSGDDRFLTPAITNARGKVVRVQVPPGFEQVTIERRTARRSKTWTTCASLPCSVDGGEVIFNLPRAWPKSLLRVIGRQVAVPPPVFPGRISNFYPPKESSGEITLQDNLGWTYNLTMDEARLLSLSSSNTGTLTGNVEAPRTVVESDIWKLHGDRLYVFNAYRGLQSLDLANPADPVLLGTLEFPDAGDALYLLDDAHVALLTKRGFSFTWNREPIRSGGALVICNVEAGTPKAVATLQIEGQVVESRLVGSALYIATEISVDGATRRSIRVTGYDLADPANPIQRNSVVIAPLAQDAYSYVGAVQASEDYFMVAEHHYTGGWGRHQTRVSLVDISSPTGALKLRGAVNAAGFVGDKFKMQERGGILTLISDVQSARHTKLENFNMRNAGVPVPMGSLVLGQNESVRGTRFDGARVYVVTFLQIDPLWIVDNSKPSAPEIVGHLEIPGFSTYLEPLGDRLVTIGLLDGRATVSLFDVGDPKNPKVLSQLPVTEHSAWSEATWNEKAFSVNPEAGLIMLPVDQGWSRGWNVSATSSGGIQLIDLEREQLRVRGCIDRPFVPRRSAFHRGTVVAIGNAALLTADITDRDHPQILAEVQLAWRTDFAWPVGDYVLQVGAEIGGAHPVVTVAPRDNANAALSSVLLGSQAVLAADLQGEHLYVVQRAAGNSTALPAATGYTLTIFNVRSVPQVVQAGQVFLPSANAPYANARLLWPQPGTAVIASQERSYSYWDHNYIHFGDQFGDLTRPVIALADTAASTLTVANSSLMIVGRYFGFSAQGLNLVACDVMDPAAPKFLAGTSIAPARAGTFSEVFAAAGKLFVSHQAGWDYVPYLISFGAPDLAPEPHAAGRHYLHVVDYIDPAAPVARPPVSSPGVLKGLAKGGTVVCTLAWQYEGTGYGIAATTAVHASVYDGHKLELASHIPLPNGSRALAMGETIFTFSNKPETNAAGHSGGLTALWELQADLQFLQRDEVVFGGANETVRDGVLFVTEWNGCGDWLGALDFSNPADLRPIGFLSVPRVDQGLHRLSGDRDHGFWLPAGDFGVLQLTVPSL